MTTTTEAPKRRIQSRRWKAADLLEDAEFLARHGVPLPLAAERMEYRNSEALVSALNNIGAHDVVRRLRENDPDWEGDQGYALKMHLRKVVSTKVMDAEKNGGMW
jgi:hypothetical protein